MEKDFVLFDVLHVATNRGVHTHIFKLSCNSEEKYIKDANESPTQRPTLIHSCCLHHVAGHWAAACNPSPNTTFTRLEVAPIFNVKGKTNGAGVGELGRCCPGIAI